MVKISLDEKNWKSLVSTAANGISDIEDIKVSSIGKTTLTRFKTFVDIENNFNTTLEHFKTYSAANAKKMTKVADKIVAEDKKAANQIKKNTVRFK
ncbi:hypothetical protein H702_09925 [Streptococcus equinus JB1]|jgi:DNA-directed RNA polymerase subunit F|uniref:TIGR04197 family type VII secretion effector n=1 Tax=Streptococcus equinus JB1 TaxID=1294274 RepID=A0A091BLW5_STREI|nr:hypothetical protein [Streptococcus equinus]KFN85440.1 hypothetical protein H702_09925 [Streptococcus equinus JB1]MEE1325558.1 hypothetical protein [Streptococcus sp.]SFL45994.1 hypothetical protein SAMN02910290_01871 [Streptococcus equinus JB1]